jgi:DNA polymerase-3 subunit epsilon
MREIALDTETTGLDPESGHRLVEVGAVEMWDRVRTGVVFHSYLNPERDMPAEAERIHGLSGAFLSDKPVFAQVVSDFLAFLGESPLIIHNAAFDLKCLNHELRRLGFAPLTGGRVTDTMLLSRKKFPGQPASLDALCRRFSIDLSARTKHGALLDAELLAEVYLELTGGRQAALSLSDIRTQAAEAAPPLETLEIPYRRFPADARELVAHKDFLSGLKTPIWREFLPEESTEA